MVKLFDANFEILTFNEQIVTELPVNSINVSSIISAFSLLNSNYLEKVIFNNKNERITCIANSDLIFSKWEKTKKGLLLIWSPNSIIFLLNYLTPLFSSGFVKAGHIDINFENQELGEFTVILTASNIDEIQEEIYNPNDLF